MHKNILESFKDSSIRYACVWTRVSEGMRRWSGGRSPAHTKTAHSNTSTELLLKINTVCSQCLTKRTGDPPLPTLWLYWRISSSSSLHHLFSQSHPLTSLLYIMGAGVLHTTLLHYVYLRSLREQMTKSDMTVTASASSSYHKLWLNLLMADELTGCECVGRDDRTICFLKTGDHQGWNRWW